MSGAVAEQIPPPDGFAERIRDLLGVPEGHGARAARLLGLVFALSSALAVLKAAQTGLFLAAYPSSAIPWAFGASGLLLSATSAVSVSLAARLGPVRLAQATLWSSALASLALFALVLAGAPHAPFAAYVVLEAIAGLLVIEVWGVVTDACDPRSAKRLLPLAGLGGSLAWVVSGMLVPGLCAVVGATGLLVVGPAVLLGCIVGVRIIAARDLVGRGRGSRSVGLLDGWRRGLLLVRDEPLMRLGAALPVLALVVEQLMDYQMMAASKAHFSDPESLAGFFGVFYGVTSGLSSVALLALSGRIFARLGASSALLVTPVATSGLAVFALAIPGFGPVVALRGGYRLLKQTIWSAAMQQTMIPLPSVARSQARSLTRGVLAPIGYAVAAAVLAALPSAFDLRWLSVATLATSMATAALVAWGVRRAYLDALGRAIDARSLVLDDAGRTFASQLDPDACRALADEVAHPDPARAALAVELLGAASGDPAVDALLPGVDHPDADVRALAIEALGRLGAVRAGDAIGRRLGQDPDVDVRRSAATALRRLRVDPTRLGDALGAGRADVDAHVRAMCEVTLMEGRPSAERRVELLPMMRGGEAAFRHAAATAVTTRMMQDGAMQDALRILLADPDVNTRVAAIQAAARLQLPALLPDVVRLLDDPATAPTVAETLPQWDRAAFRAIGQWIGQAPPRSARHVTRALARMRGTDTLLRELVAHADTEVREQALRALAGAVADGDRAPWTDTAALLETELRAAWLHVSLLAGLDGGEFLIGEVERALGAARRRLVSLLVIGGHRRLYAVLEATERRSVRAADARVAEILEMALDRGLAERLVPLFEPLSRRAALEAGRRVGLADETAAEDPLHALVFQRDLHLRRAALLDVRELLATRYPSVAKEEAPMMPLYERMRFLRSVPLFGELSGGDLRSVAQIVDELAFAPRDVVLHKGDPGEELFIIAEGHVAIRDGDVQLARFGPREFFGELSVLDRAPRSADAVCETDARLLRLKGADLAELMAKRPRIGEEILLVVVRRLREATRQLRER